MSLSNYNPETTTVDLPGRGGSLTVRGLSFQDLTALIRDHRETIEKLFNDYSDDGSNAHSLLTKLLTNSPEFCAHVIALACDEPEAVDNALRLPLTAQLDALIAVGKMTFEEAGGVKKFLEQIIMIIQGVTGVMEQLPASQTLTELQKKAKKANTGT